MFASKSITCSVSLCVVVAVVQTISFEYFSPFSYMNMHAFAHVFSVWFTFFLFYLNGVKEHFSTAKYLRVLSTVYVYVCMMCAYMYVSLSYFCREFNKTLHRNESQTSNARHNNSHRKKLHCTHTHTKNNDDTTSAKSKRKHQTLNKHIPVDVKKFTTWKMKRICHVMNMESS